MRVTTGERWFYRCNGFILLLASLSCLYPIINVLAVSLSDNDAVVSGNVYLWPVEPNLESYRILIDGTLIFRSFANSVLLTAVGVALSLVFTFLAAYPLSRPMFYARKPYTLAILFTMLFSGGTIPSYLLVKSLGLVNSYFAIWLPGLISAYNMLIMKNYFENLPVELEEAARMDGAGELSYITRVIVPLSLPMLATIALFYGVSLWNAFSNVLIYINESTKYNLNVFVQQMIQAQSLAQELHLQPEEVQRITPEGVKSAGVILMIVPLMVVYPFIQRFFVKGVLIGSVKG